MLAARSLFSCFFFLAGMLGGVFAVCQLTGITHSCGNSQFGQNICLQKKPDADDAEKNSEFFHNIVLLNSFYYTFYFKRLTTL